MSEETVDDATDREPGHEHPGAALWSVYLDWLRQDLVDAVRALDPARQRVSSVPSGWTPLELLSHVVHMEQRWFVWGFLGEPVDDPWGDWDVAEPWDDRPGRWRVLDDVTLDDLARLSAAVAERTRAVLGEHPLHARASPEGRLREDPPTLEWICLHVCYEYARHSGHLDVVVELGG